ncbi:hypothetical protein ES319_D13G145600v1 [Gossypium barbadense]|uniref:Uncharacterized protein n=2 Tax=Gossypium TaxID=3633 RepID=A0A5J5NLR4_GOSBA|nr:hypothetical protein ES319_D13G145600v1 [Gossypium barbadense]TYG37615.1 hypothetical protein ES288_D13G155400v1 [Gossypium darwinii]
MVRQPYLTKGTWSRDEDQKLIAYITRYGIWNWNECPDFLGRRRNPNRLIHLQKTLGNRWSVIAARLPQRTDNDIKNYWNTRLKKRINLEDNNSASATTSATETNSGIEEKSSGADSSLLFGNIMLDSPVYATFSTLGSNLSVASFLEQARMIEGLDCEAMSQNSQLCHSHHQQYYDLLDYF